VSRDQTMPPFLALTKRQLEILGVINDLRARHGRPPTSREIARESGASSHSYTGRVIRKLKARGLYPAPQDQAVPESTSPARRECPHGLPLGPCRDCKREHDEATR
jgi:SOS-response transcriptional repressor LexA